MPIFVTKIRRHLQTIELPNAVIEIAFDDGAIEAGEQSEPVSEVELELKAGDVGALYEFGMSLLDVAPLHVGTSSKAERGYALAFDMPPVAVKAGPAGISAADDIDEATAKLLRSCHRHLMANLAAARSGRDPEGVHQMRVALRRLRSAVSILQRDVPVLSLHAITPEAKQLARVLGPARSWDVLVAELSKIDNASLVDVNLDAVRRAAAKFRATSYAVARDALSDPRNSRFMLSLGRLLERRSWYTEADSETLVIVAEPVTALARRALTRIGRKAIKQGNHFRQLSPEARHKLRLTLKKLRYATEFFLPLYRGQASARKYLKRLSKLQDVLGADHDVTMTRPLLHDIGQSTVVPDFHQAVGAIIGWQSRHRIEAARALQERWRSFEKATPFWSS